MWPSYLVTLVLFSCQIIVSKGRMPWENCDVWTLVYCSLCRCYRFGILLDTCLMNCEHCVLGSKPPFLFLYIFGLLTIPFHTLKISTTLYSIAVQYHLCCAVLHVLVTCCGQPNPVMGKRVAPGNMLYPLR
jgi:hypothetical protein